MMDADISLFAELLKSRFGPEADAEAWRRARHFQMAGDHKNARAWQLILQHVQTTNRAAARHHTI